MGQAENSIVIWGDNIMSNNFISLKNKALEKFFSNLNPQQQKAVFNINGPLLILAGAGSGKTTVLINRILYMINFGNAYENQDASCENENNVKFLNDYINGVTTDDEKLVSIVGSGQIKPWNILAITFTNKAAEELKERISKKLGDHAQGITASTFHKVCIYILRREAAKIGFSSNFTIYDSDDSRRTIKSILAQLNISDKIFPPKALLNDISHQKDMMITPAEYLKTAENDYRLATIGKIYDCYQKTLKDYNAMDFDDIINYTVKLFEENPDVLDHYQNLYKYIMVDEFQDTNMAQFKLISLLSNKYHNICAVGDDDQSIYKFRGAVVENILNFDNHFNCDPANGIIRLEQNYRSTQNILDSANGLIKNNSGRKGKNLWTDKGNGEQVYIYKARDERGEAKFIAQTILDNVSQNGKFSDNAVLYRLNAQSNSLEQAFIKLDIPYRIFGGPKFYDRKEIKDVLSYLQVINNHWDMLRLRRIINEPKRGIGETTVGLLSQISSDLGENPVEVMKKSGEYAPLYKRSKQLTAFSQIIEELTEIASEVSLEELLDAVLEKTGYAQALSKEGNEGINRLENIAELKSSMKNYEDEADEPTLEGFLEEIALFTDIDTMDENGDYVTMMTIHSAKGLEFNNVYVAGLEENIFPSIKSKNEPADLEEERRLAYVAITRARNKLYLSYAGIRTLYGRSERNMVSRFIKELPQENLSKLEQDDWYDEQISEGISATHNISLSRQLEQLKTEKENHNFEQNFTVGDRIYSKAFGEGTIITASPMAGDTLLEVAFDSKGTKKIMANYARITKI